MKESTVLAECLEWLAQRRVFAWRNNTGAFAVDSRYIRYGHPGSSDILGVAPDGRILCVECKAPNGRQTADQKLFEKCITSRGGIYIVARSTADLAAGLERNSVKLP